MRLKSLKSKLLFAVSAFILLSGLIITSWGTRQYSSAPLATILRNRVVLYRTASIPDLSEGDRPGVKRTMYPSHDFDSPWPTYLEITFTREVNVPIEEVTHKKLLSYLDYLLDRGLQPKTINCHLDSIRGFYHYLIEEEQVAMVNPVRRGYALRLSRPLPRHLRDEEVERLLKVVHHQRDRAMVMLMLRCGLRVEEVVRLKLAALDLRRSQVFVHQGKGAKDRVVYLSDDAYEALDQYLRMRPVSRIKEVFLVDKGRCRGKAISVRGIQKRLEYYARHARLKV
jgi:site-specific recombinase XerD